MDKLNVWFTGAQGTGKTTQLELFMQAHPEYNQVKFKRRELVLSGELTVNREATLVDEILIAYDVSSAFKKAAYPSICDRTWADKCAYAQCLPYTEEVLNALDIIYRGCFEEIISYGVGNSVMIYFPPTIPLVGSDIRDGDEEYQKNVDYWIQYYLATFEIPYYTLTSTSIGDRTMEIEQIVWGKL